VESDSISSTGYVTCLANRMLTRRMQTESWEMCLIVFTLLLLLEPGSRKRSPCYPLGCSKCMIWSLYLFTCLKPSARIELSADCSYMWALLWSQQKNHPTKPNPNSQPTKSYLIAKFQNELTLKKFQLKYMLICKSIYN
jgi:hypothetical protein